MQKLDLFFGSLGVGEQQIVANMVRSSLRGVAGAEVQGFGDDNFVLALTGENAPLLAQALGLPEHLESDELAEHVARFDDG